MAAMIIMAMPLAIGNAVRLPLQIPPGTRRTRVLRAPREYIAGPFDDQAVVVADGVLIGSAADMTAENGTQYWYRAYHLIGNDWIETPMVTATCQATYQDNSFDVLEFIRDRLDKGLRVEAARGVVRHQSGNPVKVMTSAPVFEDKAFPLVTVHLTSDKDGERFIGEAIDGDLRTGDEYNADYIEQDGWLADIELTIIVWSLNGDERSILRRAVRRLIVGNLGLLESQGAVVPSLQASDNEDFETYSAPVYQTTFTLRCQAPVAVGGVVNAIDDVTVTVIEELHP